MCAAWLAAVLLALTAALTPTFGAPLFERLSSGGGTIPGESQDGAERLAGTANTGPTVLLVLDDVSVDATAVRSQLRAAARDPDAPRPRHHDPAG